jgi:hypothetical protein
MRSLKHEAADLRAFGPFHRIWLEICDEMKLRQAIAESGLRLFHATRDPGSLVGRLTPGVLERAIPLPIQAGIRCEELLLDLRELIDELRWWRWSNE